MDKLQIQEKKKIKELFYGKEEANKLNWMYKGPNPDTDEYLLGRRIDKFIEPDTEKTKDDEIGALFSDRIKANMALDMAAKMREDPLFIIRKKEEEARKRLLDNPVKMRHLEKLIKQKEEEKRSKRKKKKKHKERGSNTDSCSSDSDNDLIKEYLSVLNKKQKALSQGSDKSAKQDRYHQRRDIRGHSREQADFRNRPQRQDYYSPYLKRHETERPSKRKNYHRDRSPEGPTRYPASSNDVIVKRRKHHCPSSEDSDEQADSSRRRRRNSSSDEVVRRKQFHSYRLMKTSETPRSASYSPLREKAERTSSIPRSQSPKPKHTSRSSAAHQSAKSYHRSRSPKQDAKRKMTDAERQKRLMEMMDNAKWREEQRQQSIKKYGEEVATEESQMKQGSSSDFLNPIMSQHASQSSVEERIRRNIYNIQRTKIQLDKDFTKK